MKNWTEADCADLVASGVLIQDAEILTDADGAEASARFIAYVERVESIRGDEPVEVLDALIDSIPAGDDYGAHQVVYTALWSFPAPHAAGRFAARLPSTGDKLGWDDSVFSFMLPVADDGEMRGAFVAAAREWTEAQRATVVAHLAEQWVENPDWQPLLEGLGWVTPVASAGNDIPEEWPEEWKAAAETMRAGVAPRWADTRDPQSFFPMVFALLRLDHGKKWREVELLTNPLVFFGRVRVYPKFLAALAELPADEREEVLAAIGRANPARGRQFTADLTALQN